MKTLILPAAAATLLLFGAACKGETPSGGSHAAHVTPATRTTIPTEATRGDAHAHHHQGEHAALPAAQALAGNSIFHLTGTWQTQGGSPFSLSDLRGKPAIVVMLYTSCTTACPLLINDARRLEQALPEDLRGDMQIVLASIDPQVDTPERLAEFAGKMRLDTDRWTLLHGQSGDVRELAAVLGVQYRRNADGSYTHSNLITVLDAEGRIVHRVEGLSKPMEAEAAAIAGLVGN